MKRKNKINKKLKRTKTRAKEEKFIIERIKISNNDLLTCYNHIIKVDWLYMAINLFF